MATIANLPPGAIPTNGASDPFVGGPPGPLRYASLDSDQLSIYSSNSPSQAKRALEAHLRDTDRRIQDASRLGTTLLQQRKELSARLEDVKQVQQDNEVPADLRKKLTELEKEYNEVGKESARAFLPKSRAPPPADVGDTPTVLSSQGRESPTKVSAPSRRQRNQPNNRVHDIEFATEISTSLLAQVRQLQAALSEKDDALRETSSAKAQLEAEAAGLVQRIKQMDEHEQRFKDENWNLEMKVQELEGSLQETTDKHDRLHQTLKSTQTEKTTAQRELDELRISHDKLIEDHAVVKRQQEGDLHGLRRDLTTHQTENEVLHKKIDELTMQNTELARAVSAHWNQRGLAADNETLPSTEDLDDSYVSPEHNVPLSPVKGTPGHGMLESETLRSSLNHAHRMIQNLKNNIHREKTEKIELKRMLQDARDELEARRGETGIGAAMAKKRKGEADNKNKKPGRLDRLGANRSSTIEVQEDEPDWEDHDGERTPSKSRFAPMVGGVLVGSALAGAAALGHDGFADESSTTDAFETANEKESTEFETGNEGFSDHDSDLTETEGGNNRSSTASRPSLSSSKAGDRRSYMSTASTSADDDDEIRTPVPALQPKYKLRMSRGGARRTSSTNNILGDSPSLASPSSSVGTPQATAGQSLGDELDALEDESVEGTPSRMLDSGVTSPETVRNGSVESIPSDTVLGEHEHEIGSRIASPGIPGPRGEQEELAHQTNAAMLAHESVTRRVEMVDAGVMTEPWQSDRHEDEEKTSLRDRGVDVMGGALAGFGLGGLLGSQHQRHEEHEQAEARDGGGLVSAAIAPTEPHSAARPSTNHGAPQDAEVIAAAAALPTSAGQAGPIMDPTKVLSRENSAVPPMTATMLNQSTSIPHDGGEVVVPPVALQHSMIISQETEPLAPKMPAPASDLNSGKDTVAGASIPVFAPAPLSVPATRAQDLGFSSMGSQHYEPEAPRTPLTPLVPKRSSRRLDQLYDEDEPTTVGDESGLRGVPGTEAVPPGAGFFASVPSLSSMKSRSQVNPADIATPEDDRRIIEPKVFGGVREGSSGIPTLIFGADDAEDSGYGQSGVLPASTGSMPPHERSISTESMIPVTKPLQVKKPMVDESSQTAVSGAEIDDMMRDKSRTSSMTDASQKAGALQRRSIDGMAVNDALLRQPRRPASVGSMRNKAIAVPPPLPEDSTARITAAQHAPTPSAGSFTTGSMGPPIMPASAYKSTRPLTPAERAAQRSMSRDGTTPRPMRHRDSRNAVPGSGPVSRRGSVSSFASEIDERFNIGRGDLIYPSDVVPATDPRMIQAITQTMIGEYLWKYTRKAGRSETSSTRHRRFFWVHPYTRTLYWSESDPSTAGKNMLKAKSMAIQSVRVITDDNTNPPGLHRKSIVVVTPGREIVFTAPTGQRHETWFNALSYLLLRTEQEKKEADDTFDAEDIGEFNPGFSLRRSISRMTGRDGSQSRDRQSLSSYNSRGTRTSSPRRAEPPINSLSQRQSASALRAKNPTLQPPTLTSTTQAQTATNLTANPEPAVRTTYDHGSFSGRLSSLTSRFRPGSSQRGPSFSTSRGRSSFGGAGQLGDPGEIYDASVISNENESAEDLRAVIERQEREAGRLENVRACCDGKHDVGSLPRNGRHASFGSRFAGGSHSHSPAHGHPRAEPMKASQRPRRGE
ncbi:hypothetical protein LTR62_002823 [Meristemomyces frigidus]|uniref:PH domain-containing protein n=1 Tax=Meristemomyces frigidus TaxID=1508187 RepID=A0AAN7YU80_9PEZI|nr:hypothetical protein LTR62_002823 [Meristemomyces frigidus]